MPMKIFGMLLAISLTAVVTYNSCPESSPKVIAFLGDSNLWQGKEDCSDQKAWSHWVVKALGCKDVVARSFARSGATITNTASTPNDTTHYTTLLNDSNTLYSQAMRLKGAISGRELPAPDVIFMYGGSNDAWFMDKRPDIFDDDESMVINSTTSPSEVTSLEGSMRLTLAILRDAAPSARIVIVGPPFLTKAPREKVSQVSDVIERVAHRYGYPMVRLDSDSLINPDMERRRFTMTRDGAHTTPDGARIIANHILNSTHIK